MPEDLDLGERDHDEEAELTAQERTVHTQGYDLSVNTLFEQWTDKILVLPEFQREYVWDNAKASRLVESLLTGIPIPILYFAETPAATYEIVDGHQRVFSLVRFIDNQFALTGLRLRNELRGLRFHRLPERDQRFLRTRVMRAIIISADSHPTMKFEIFERLNTGAVALNAQEIRNALYRGSLNDTLKLLERNASFRICMDRSKPRARMVDRELVLRFLALRDEFTDYRPPLVRFLNDYMSKNRLADTQWLGQRSAVFEQVSATAAGIYGAGAFRRTDASGEPLERNVNRALFDTQMLVLSVSDQETALAARVAVLEASAALYDDPKFMDTISRATGDKTRTRSRIRRFGAALSHAGVPVDLKALSEGL